MKDSDLLFESFFINKIFQRIILEENSRSITLIVFKNFTILSHCRKFSWPTQQWTELYEESAATVASIIATTIFSIIVYLFLENVCVFPSEFPMGYANPWRHFCNGTATDCGSWVACDEGFLGSPYVICPYTYGTFLFLGCQGMCHEQVICVRACVYLSVCMCMCVSFHALLLKLERGQCYDRDGGM